MKKIFTILMLFTMLVPSYAEVQSFESKQKMQKIDFGQKIFRKKLQRKCGYTAGHWAQQHTKKEWQTHHANGTFKDELANMCPGGISVVKDKWMEPLYLFAVEFAGDSGNRPRC